VRRHLLCDVDDVNNDWSSKGARGTCVLLLSLVGIESVVTQIGADLAPLTASISCSGGQINGKRARGGITSATRRVSL